MEETHEKKKEIYDNVKARIFGETNENDPENATAAAAGTDNGDTQNNNDNNNNEQFGVCYFFFFLFFFLFFLVLMRVFGIFLIQKKQVIQQQMFKTFLFGSLFWFKL